MVARPRDRNGKLHSGRLSANQIQGSFQVIEQMAMLPPADIAVWNLYPGGNLPQPGNG
jgi:hypothetical protein